MRWRIFELTQFPARGWSSQNAKQYALTGDADRSEPLLAAYGHGRHRNFHMNIFMNQPSALVLISK